MASKPVDRLGMEISWVELGNLRQGGEVEHSHLPFADLHDLFLMKLPNDAVDVNCGEPKGFGKIRLGQRHGETSRILAIDIAHSLAKLADEMGYSFPRCPNAQANDPASQYAFINQCCPPQRTQD